MASGWQGKLKRVSRMDWEEVRVRAGQEFHKQCDLLMHRLGVRNGTARLNVGSTAGSAADTVAQRGQFFFAGNEGSERAELLRKHLPSEAAEILREADEICDHRFRLLGYENLRFTLDRGDEIDWHLDPVHGKRAPLDPWFKIPFLDFATVGDHKVIWELNRHQHLVTLAKARLLSGDDKYVRELMAQWHSWIKMNPYPLGINWASTLEVAFRSLSWIWVDQLLAEIPHCTQFRSEMAPALAFHGRYIERYLSTYYSPNTHLLGEAVALFFLGTLYPQIPRATGWKESGWQIVLHEAGRQVRPDGVYFEQSLYYHVYALDFFLYARLLADRNGTEIPPAYDAALGRMLDVVAALAQAGPAEGFGDDDGGRLWNPRRNRTEHMTDPLALGAVMYSREFSAARLTEEAIWLFGERVFGERTFGSQAVHELAHAKTSAEARSIAFPDGGIYVLADSQPYAQAMVVDAGPQGVDRSGHGHADALSLRLTMDGRRWLVDAGSGVYISKDPADRDTFRGTGAHNTMRVDGVDQAVADETFSWTHIPTTQAEEWIAGKSFTYFVGSHNGYARLEDPVVHRRHVLKIAGVALLVRDIALGRAEHELEIRWHFAPDLEVRSMGPGRVEISRVGAPSSESSRETRLCLIVPEETVWQTATEVTKTLLSPAYGAFQPAPLVRCHARVLLPAETATVLIPGTGAIRQKDEALIEPRVVSTTRAAVQAYKLDYDNESHGIFFALGNEGWSFGPWSSDARVLYCRIENERLSQLVVIGGTHVAWQGQQLLTAAGRSGFFEWRTQDAVMNSAPGEFLVTTLFEELAGGSRLSSATLDPTSSQASSPYADQH
ncbi:MAG: alginate lyase family protein [Terriglobales bacterium]|jgi:heparinase II/III-like protein